MRTLIRNERGQAVMEYILTLVVAIAIIFGGLYQLNSAFKAWAAAYFGDYISCLLEAGELPSISGTGGDAGVCAQLFKPFSWSEGRRLAAVGADKAPPPPRLSSAIQRPGGGGGGGGGAGSNGTPFAAGRTPIKPPADGAEAKGGGRATNTGSTAISNYGTPYGGGRIPLRRPDRIQIDRGSLSDDQRQSASKSSGGVARSVAESGVAQGSLKIRPSPPKRATDEGADSGLTFADFIRYLVIAGIIIALLLFLGGQALQIGKSMD